MEYCQLLSRDPALGTKMASRGTWHYIEIWVQKFRRHATAMLSHLRCAISRPQTCSRLVLKQAAASRGIHATRLARSELAPEPSEEQQEQPAQSSEGAPTGGRTEEMNPEFYKDFMQTIGADFKNADAPRKWLGGKVVSTLPLIWLSG